MPGSFRKRRVLIVVDHFPFQETLRRALDADERLELVAALELPEDIIEAVWQLRPEVVVLGVGGKETLHAVRAIRRMSPGTAVLLVAQRGDEHQPAAMKLGVKGIVMRSSPRQAFMEAIHAVGRGEIWVDPRIRPLSEGPSDDTPTESALTDREFEIAQLVALGRKNWQIAASLGITDRTVKIHLMNIFRKLSLHSRVDLIQHVLRTGLTADLLRAGPGSGPNVTASSSAPGHGIGAAVPASLS